jgi:hypothetical protein
MRRLAYLLAVLGSVLTVGLTVTGQAAAHRSGCHSWHSCPSDRHTYWWKGYASYQGQTVNAWFLCTSHPEQRYSTDVWVTNTAPYSYGITFWCTRHA